MSSLAAQESAETEKMGRIVARANDMVLNKGQGTKGGKEKVQERKKSKEEELAYNLAAVEKAQ